MTAEQAPELTLVLVAWNSAELLPDALAAFRASAAAANARVEVVVVDNGSHDDSAAVARAAGADLVVENPLNCGFVVAASQGLALARSPWLLLANPDLRVEQGFVAAVLAAAGTAPDDVASLVPEIRFASNRDVVNSRGLAVDQLGVPAERDAGAPVGAAVTGDVFGASSAASILRAEALRQVGGLEPAFFAYLEDVDVAWRLRRAGYRAVLVPDAVAVHEGSASTGEGSWLKTFLVARNRRILFRLHGPHSLKARALRTVVEAGHATVQALSGSRDASLRGRVAARRTHGYVAFARRSNRRAERPGVVVPLAPRFKLLETLRRKQRASVFMHHEPPRARPERTPRSVRRSRPSDAPVRVLVDAANLKPGQGGIRSYSMGLIAALAAEPGLDVVVASSVPEVAALGPLELVALAPATRSVIGRASWREAHLAAIARRTRAEVVVTPVPELPFRRLPVPTAVVVHDVGPLVAPALFTRNKRTRYVATLRHACSRADAIVCVSHATLFALHGATGVPAGRCSVIGEGPQLLGGPYERGGAANDPYFLYVGSLDRHKNVETLVSAFAAEGAPPGRLLLAGPLDGRSRSHPALRASRRGGPIEHLGFVPVDLLLGLYGGCTALVLPSLHEGFGLTVLEAFNAGVPVVASDIPSVREVAGDGAFYVRKALEAQAWQEALRRVQVDETLRERLRAGGRAAAAEYTWEAVGDRFAELLVRIATGRPRESSAAQAGEGLAG